ncbi:MAG: transketolase, partial [Planctomycetes bacterium]|nr:transketolase [Planctomycetota bacterium]
CAYRCVELMANIDGLCYLRTHRPTADFIYSMDETFEVGGSKNLRRGDRITLIGSGYMLHTVLAVADRLAESGLACNVFDVYTFPLDAAPILEAARQAGGIILTVEDNYAGALQAELAEAAALDGDVRVHGLTVNRIPKSALTAEEIFSHVGVSSAYIMEKAKQLVGE